MKTFVSNINEKLGVIFYDPEISKFLNNLKNSKLEYDELGNLIDKDKLTVGSTPIYVDEGIDFIRVQNIDKDGNINLEKCKKITIQDHQKNIKSKIDFLDLLLVVTGATVGKTAMFEHENKEANINQNIVKITVDKSKISPYFLYYYLKSKAGNMQLIRNSQRMAQEYLNYPSITSIEIAFPKSLATQERILKKTENFRKKINQIGMDYLNIIKRFSTILETQVKFNKDISPKKNFVSKNLDERLDCLFTNPSYELIKKELEILKNKKIIQLPKMEQLGLIKEVISKKDFEELKVKKFKYIEIGHTTEHPDIIKGYEEDILINLPTRARRFIQENDVLIPRPIGSTDKITIVPKELDGELCSTGFIILRAKDYDTACLLTTIMKSDIVQKQFFYLQSGCVQPEISTKNFEKILIPLLNSKEMRERLTREFKVLSKKSRELLESYNSNKSKLEEYFLEQLLK